MRYLFFMSFDRDMMQRAAALLAKAGVYVGTSSWKYDGWFGQLYTPARYEYRGKVAATRFKGNCLTEYAEVFKTVCVDSAYYTFPSRESLEGMAAQVPSDFRFAFKVTDAITVKKFPRLDRIKDRAGKQNENFLNADLFASAFLSSCEHIRTKVGLLMFEFSRFWPSDYEHGRDFVADLDTFFGKLPKGWPYAVEIRNAHWLREEYFSCLARHGVTHVFNSWDAMPPVGEQMVLPGSRTNPARVAARFLLKPGRKYDEAVKAFSPYNRIQDVYPEARKAGAELMLEGCNVPDRETYIYVNNRLEGNAPQTIEAFVESEYFRVMEGFEDRRSGQTGVDTGKGRDTV